MSHAHLVPMPSRPVFALSPERPLAEEVRRVLLEQAQEAHQLLLDPPSRESAVHGARKACKRGRAALRLIQPALETAVYTQLADGFRGAAQELGPIRDADVMRRLAADTGGAAPLPVSEAEGLARLAASRDRLAALCDLIAAVPLRIKRDHVIAGFERNYRKARRRMVLARAEPTGESLHDWRKAVKAHCYHLRLLEPLWPPILSAFAAEADQLQETLGDHHDLSVLMAHRLAAGTLDGEAAQGLQARSDALEAEAFTQGTRLYASQHRVMGTWLRAQWSALR